MGIALGTPCEGIMYSLEPDGCVPIDMPIAEGMEQNTACSNKGTASTTEKEFRPATCPLTKNDSKCHANFKEHLELKNGGCRKVDKFNQRPCVRVFQRPHSSVLPCSGSSTPRAVCGSSRPDNSSSSSSSVYLDSCPCPLRVDAASYRPAGDTGSFTNSRDLQNETWQPESPENSRSCSMAPACAAPPPLPSAAAGEAAPGASNAYAVPHWVEVAWEERPDVFWDTVDHFFAHGVWPHYRQQSVSLMNLCEGQHIDPESPSDGLRGFAPIWIFLLKEDDERVFRAAVDFYFECGRFPEMTFMSPSFVAMCEGMGIGEFDFYE